MNHECHRGVALNSQQIFVERKHELRTGKKEKEEVEGKGQEMKGKPDKAKGQLHLPSSNFRERRTS